ncbi:MAG TPA: hypothetical protein VI072_02825 [Polyangiaceae bacterium]
MESSQGKSHRSEAGHRALLRALMLALFVLVLAGLVAAVVAIIRPRLASVTSEPTSYVAASPAPLPG